MITAQVVLDQRHAALEVAVDAQVLLVAQVAHPGVAQPGAPVAETVVGQLAGVVDEGEPPVRVVLGEHAAHGVLDQVQPPVVRQHDVDRRHRIAVLTGSAAGPRRARYSAASATTAGPGAARARG